MLSSSLSQQLGHKISVVTVNKIVVSFLKTGLVQKTNIIKGWLLNFTLISGFRIREFDKHFQHRIQQSPGPDENHSSKEAQSNATDSGETWT